MRRLAEGQSDDAHALWNKVIETRMVEFLEFDMAARYLRTGAPTPAAPADRRSRRDDLTLTGAGMWYITPREHLGAVAKW